MRIAKTREEKYLCRYPVKVLNIEGYSVFGHEEDLLGEYYAGYYFSDMIYLQEKQDADYICIKYPQYFQKR